VECNARSFFLCKVKKESVSTIIYF